MKIAIIGLGFRLPNDTNSLDSLYDKLTNKIDCVSEHPKDRFNIRNYYDKENNSGKMRTLRGGYTNNIYDFDAEFFKISPKEAKSMDPQQRKMLELVYECIDDAKINANSLRGSKTGVFIGSCSMEYFNAESENPINCNEYSITGGLLTLLSNRISYFYDLKGPSLTLDTACSSSGHALHLACQSIINGESEMCFVGGSNILLSPETFVGFSQATMLSPDGKCKTFDEKADGYVRGEGFVSLLIKPLEKAIEDNNKIYAVINKTGVNQDGKTASITMPNPDAQIDLLEELYQDISLSDLLYIEAHGTGTIIGDYHETLSIGNVLGKNKKEKLNIGSIKTNIGHLEAASGLASILKVCLIMQKRQLLPNLHFETPSSRIDFEELNLQVVDKIIEIKQDKIIIGVNNFGFGGSNFHCILENYENINLSTDDIRNNNSLHLLAIHGSSEESIDSKIANWINYSNDDFMKYLYNQNKKPFSSQSKIFVVKDKDDFENIIFNQEEGLNPEDRSLYLKFSEKRLDSAFVFCGQGAQYIDMGYQLTENFPKFYQVILECDKLWLDLTGESFIEKNKLFLPEFKNEDKTNIKINQPIVAQPATFFYQVALFELYKSFGIIPDAVIGHSAGEVAAFYASESISLEDCIKISYYRSIHQQKTNGLGNMIVINKSFQELIKIASGFVEKLELACINDRNTIVLSGKSEDIQKINRYLDEKNIFNRIIRGNCPFHSSFQDLIKDDIIFNLKNIKFNQPKIKLISTVLGKEIDMNTYSNDYWWKNIRNKVLFYDGLKKLNYIDIFIEIGPHPVLSNNINNMYHDIDVLYSSHRKKDSSIVFMLTLANLWGAGYNLVLENFGIVNSTHYPKVCWNHKTFTNIPHNSYERRHGIENNFDLIKFDASKYSYIKDHIIDTKFIFPTVGYLDIVLRYFNSKKRVILKNIEIKNMYVPKNDMIEFRWQLQNNYLSLKSFDYKTYYFSSQIFTDNNILESYKKLDINESSYNFKLSGDECYQMLKSKKFNFGDNMKSIEYVLVKDEECLIKLIEKKYSEFNMDPSFLDAGLLTAVIINGITNNFTYLPVSAKEIEINLISKPHWIYSEIVENNINYVAINVEFYDKNFRKVGSYTNYRADNVSNYGTNNCYNLEYEDFNLINLDDNSKNVFQYGNDLVDIDYQLVSDLSGECFSNLVYNKENESLVELKNDIIMMENNVHIKSIYFLLNKGDNGLKLGFLRTYINESVKKVHLIILTEDDRNKNLINDIIFQKDDINSEYYLIDGQVKSIRLKKYNKPKIKYDRYYFNKTGKGLNNLGFYPIITKKHRLDITVKTKSSALNFKDLMVTLGIVKGDYLGYEASGVIVESRHPKYKVGDEVIVIKNKEGKTFGNYIYCSDNEIFMKPKDLSFSQASSIGIIFGTVYICLIERARIKKGDTVLIHSATGGIGQAAIQICKMVGANIIATAGNVDKREKLKNTFGIRYVSDSRNPNTFKKDVLKFTENVGVDVILNSLSGDSLRANFDIIKKGGIIVEIGKRDSIENNSIRLDKFLDSITYTSVHFDRLFNSNPEYIRNIINMVIYLFEEKTLNPIEIKEFHISEIEEAISYMSKGLHTGKIVLKIDDWIPDEFQSPETIFDKNMYYLITGGLGGLGIELIRWMNLYGANNFIITSRSRNRSKRANRIINKLEENGCKIIIAKVDVANYQSLKNYFFFDNFKYPIDGIFHLAGTTKDSMIKDLDKSDIENVLKPKVDGCINLGKLFAEHKLNYFVTFSSISSLIGNVGQSAYSGANCFLDKYCYDMNIEKGIGLSVNVGAVGGVGMIHNDYYLSKTMISNKFNFIHYDLLFENLFDVLSTKSESRICISNQEWEHFNNIYPKNSLLANFKKKENKITTKNNNNIIREQIIDYLKKLLECNNIETNKNLTSYGIDSIMSLQLSTWFNDKLSFNITQLQILQGITVDEILEKCTDNTLEDNNNRKKEKKIKTFNRKIDKLNIKEIDSTIFITEEEPTNNNYFIIIIICALIYFLWYIFY